MDPLVESAVWGAVVGSTMGSPFEGAQGFKRLTYYEPVPTRMAANASIDAWHLHCVTTQDLGPTHIGQRLHKQWQHHSDASGFAHANSDVGFVAPASGAFSNPLSQSSSALLRSLFWGILFRGNSIEAKRWASFDAAWDHSGEAVSVAGALAALTASAQPGLPTTSLVRILLDNLSESKIAPAAVTRVLAGTNSGDPLPTIVASVRQSLKIADESHAVLSLATILGSLLASKDATTAICLSAGCGHSSTVNAGVTGVMSSLIWGVPDDLRQPLGDNYVATTSLRECEPSKSVSEFIQRIGETRARFLITAESDTEEQPPVLPRHKGIPEHECSLVYETNGLRTSVEYLGSVAPAKGQSIQLAVNFHNSLPFARDVVTTLSASEDVKATTRMSSFRLEPDMSTSHGLIVEAMSDENRSLTLVVDGEKFRIPVPTPQTWYVAGPFGNEDDQAFTKEFPPERRQIASDPFAGRSGLSVRWQEAKFGSRVVDVEPYFMAGPGVVFLYAEVSFKDMGEHQVVASGAPGVIFKMDDRRVVQYLDAHDPIPRATAPYIGTFHATERTRVLVKLIRGLDPFSALTLYFLDSSGRVVDPISFHPLTT